MCSIKSSLCCTRHHTSIISTVQDAAKRVKQPPRNLRCRMFSKDFTYASKLGVMLEFEHRMCDSKPECSFTYIIHPSENEPPGLGEAYHVCQDLSSLESTIQRRRLMVSSWVTGTAQLQSWSLLGATGHRKKT